MLLILQKKESLSYSEIEKELGVKSINKLVSKLLKRDAIFLFETVKEKYKPKKIKRIGKTKVDLKRGDLFFFSAGQIWHEILPVFDKSRVTAGAFLKTNMKNELEVWV